ncbi:hypothetical protein [Prauserella flavalba]
MPIEHAEFEPDGEGHQLGEPLVFISVASDADARRCRRAAP